MPHYKNGREAKVGDHVVGRPYGLDRSVGGIVTCLSPGGVHTGGAPCDCKIAFHAIPFDEPAPLCVRRTSDGGAVVRHALDGELHGGEGGGIVAIYDCEAVGSLGDFLHVEDATEIEPRLWIGEIGADWQPKSGASLRSARAAKAKK